MSDPAVRADPATLTAWVEDARARTFALAEAYRGGLEVPVWPTVNPPLWELGHVGWFQRRWLRRAAGQPVEAADDALYDSARVAHRTRWGLKYPSLDETLAALARTRDAALEAVLLRPGDAVLAYHVLLGVFHEDMHGEALTYTLQALERPGPAPWTPVDTAGRTGGAGRGRRTPVDTGGDVRFAACEIRVGSELRDGFAWDNEMPPATRRVGAFELARCAVTEGDFARFVEAGGYEVPALWDLPAGRDCPVMWRLGDEGWQVREFDRWRPLDPLRPVIQVSAHEAIAYCRMAGRRLPTEWEWEVAATTGEGRRRRYPWGSAFPDARRANLDGRAMGTLPVTDLAKGDSVGGCRQLIGNVWEWTASTFQPLPGFAPGPYAEYSAPWFDGRHTVLRGGCFATRARLIRGAYRNFFSPDRTDIFAGFRTAAREA